MSYFAVVRSHGPAWDDSCGLREQERWREHADFMDALTAEGFIVLGGPITNGALLVIDAESESEIHSRLDADPWSPMGVLETASVERWEILLRAPGH